LSQRLIELDANQDGKISEEELRGSQDPALSSLLLPDRQKVEQIVKGLDRDKSGDLSVAEVKVLFSQLLDIPIMEIPDDHEEVVAFTMLNNEQMVDDLLSHVGKEDVDKYFDKMVREHDIEEAPEPIDAAHQQMVRRIVEAMDADDSGIMEVGEVKLLLSKMLEIPVEALLSAHSPLLLIPHRCPGHPR
jgi:hypothetical protein